MQCEADAGNYNAIAMPNDYTRTQTSTHISPVATHHTHGGGGGVMACDDADYPYGKCLSTN